MNKRKLLRFGLITVVALGAGNFGWGVHANSKLSASLDDVRDAGIPLSTSEFMGDRDPAGNSAAHLYLAGISLCRAAGSWSEMLDGFDPFADIDQGQPAEDIPKSLVAALPALAEGVRILQRAAKSGECFLPMKAGTTLEGRSSQMDLIPLMDLSNVLGAATLAYLAEGDEQQVIETVEASIALAEYLRHEPLLITQVLRVILVGNAVQSSMALVVSLENPGEWLTAQEHLQVESFPANLIADALASEIPFFTQLIQSLPDAADGRALSRMIDDGGSSFLPQIFGTPYIKSVQADYFDYMSAAVLNARQPLPQSIESARELSEELMQNGSAVAKSFAISTDGMLTQYAQVASRLRLLHIGTGALEFRKDNGQWPATLADFGADAWTDPLTGGPFELTVSDGALTVSSRADLEPAQEPVAWTLR